jgi:penicillin-binding protein 1A
MAVALKGQPSAPLEPPSEGLVQQDGNWFYTEYSGELAIARIGLPPPLPVEEAASEPPSFAPPINQP